MFNLVVLSDFVATVSKIFHEIGTLITDAEEVLAILKSPQSTFVTKVAATSVAEILAEKHDETNHDPDAVR